MESILSKDHFWFGIARNVVALNIYISDGRIQKINEVSKNALYKRL